MLLCFWPFADSTDITLELSRNVFIKIFRAKDISDSVQIYTKALTSVEMTSLSRKNRTTTTTTTKQSDVILPVSAMFENCEIYKHQIAEILTMLAEIQCKQQKESQQYKSTLAKFKTTMKTLSSL